jgi:hypothetical protein
MSALMFEPYISPLRELHGWDLWKNSQSLANLYVFGLHRWRENATRPLHSAVFEMKMIKV